jgi:7,8-dihydropterin-6-yl-methyl-4-(beta-D-ribofuranosyl)aminobenzene 5'-phosphate synthase
MNIKILYDSQAINNQYKTGWGFSCLINNHILFDTGRDGNSLINNLSLMKIDSINKIIISHEHYDHTGGLWQILEQQKDLPIYICPNFSEAFKNRIKQLGSEPIDVTPWQEITNNIFTTGELSAQYHGQPTPEQALVIKTAKGLVVITGCSHPGIITILTTIKKHFPDDKIYLVLGGFHLLDKNKPEIEKIVKEFKTLKVQKVAPLHCTGDPAQQIFKNYYQDNYIQLKVGEEIDI